MGHPRAPRTDRVACPWLNPQIHRPEAEIVYVPRDDVLGYAEREGAISFDAPGAKYTHRDGKCSFESLSRTTGSTTGDCGARRVIHGATSQKIAMRHRIAWTRGDREGFALLDLDDQRQLELELPVYDASTPGRKNNSQRLTAAPDSGN